MPRTAPRKWKKEGDLGLDEAGEFYIRMGEDYVPLDIRFKIDNHSHEIWMYPDGHPEKSARITIKEYSSVIRVLSLARKMYGPGTVKGS